MNTMCNSLHMTSIVCTCLDLASTFFFFHSLFGWDFVQRPEAHTVTKSRKKSTQKNQMLLMKNPQFLSNFYETYTKLLPHEVIIFTKFHKDWTKIVDFLLMTDFRTCAVILLRLYLYLSYFTSSNNSKN